MRANQVQELAELAHQLAAETPLTAVPRDELCQWMERGDFLLRQILDGTRPAKVFRDHWSIQELAQVEGDLNWLLKNANYTAFTAPQKKDRLGRLAYRLERVADKLRHDETSPPQTVTSSPSSSPWQAGEEATAHTVMIAFKLRQKLGEGGFGEVWKGWSDELKVWAAIKLPKRDHPDQVDALKKEAFCLARIGHPAYPKLLVSSFMPGMEFLAMEFIDGERGDLWLAKSPPVPARIAVVGTLAEALAYLHEKPVIFHRDLKLENMIITPDQRPMLLDLGVAKSSLTEEQTRDPRHLANIRNTAPECIDHILKHLPGPVPYSAAQDVWSLGCIGWQLITGHHPFEAKGDTLTTIARISQRQADSDELTSISPKLAELLTSMLNPDPGQRPTMSRVAAKLNDSAGAEVSDSVQARTSSPGGWPPETAQAPSESVNTTSSPLTSPKLDVPQHPNRVKLARVSADVMASLKASRMPTGESPVYLSDGVFQRNKQGGRTRWEGVTVALVPTLDNDDSFGLLVRGPFCPNGLGKNVPNGAIEDVWSVTLPSPAIGLSLNRILVTRPSNDDIDLERP